MVTAWFMLLASRNDPLLEPVAASYTCRFIEMRLNFLYGGEQSILFPLVETRSHVLLVKFWPFFSQIDFINRGSVRIQQSPVPFSSRSTLLVLIVQRENECRYYYIWMGRSSDC
uniref:Uncharacterized protein n=1 Tax=Nelumbo nucifera TaxID=4432 RepID=A0A822XAZ5_NELNU|nr:TPA_asm: hypothetical protein HUJ06_020046 [Nelumbo nucifera]